jgi:glyoxylase-like metal-dependent hydrolase (beta-lactamase superfamily II)
VVGAQNRLSVLEDQINLFNYSDEVIPGIEAVNTSGHTPGHTSFSIQRGNESVMIIGDALTHPIISFEKAGWPSGSDQDREQGLKTRLALLDRLATDKTMLLGYHLPYPGLGRVERSNNTYRFVEV